MEFRTLAYNKSPKASRRTNFQDELAAAVSARANSRKGDQYSFLNDINEDDDDFLKELLKSRKKRTDAFKSGKSKAKINKFEFLDDEGETARPKRVSFLKTQRISSPLQDMASDLHENEHPDSPISGRPTNSSPSQHSTSFNEDHTESIDSVKSRVEFARESPRESLSHQILEGSQLDTSSPLPFDNGVVETIGPLFSESSEGRSHSVHRKKRKSKTPQSSGSGMFSTDSVSEREPPRPKPRQRTIGLHFHTMEEHAEDSGSPLSRPTTSSVSIPLSTDTASNITTVSSSDSITTRGRSQHPEGEPSFTRSTIDSGTREVLNTDDSKEHEGKYSASFEECLEDSEDHADSTRLKHVNEQSFDTRPSSTLTKTSQRSRSVGSAKVESKYMGTLKVLDRKVPLEESQPEAADSLRAAVYQEWLKKKKEKLRENLQLKKQEESLKEEKRKKEDAQKEDAIASYEAWKKKKAETLRAKAKEKQDMIIKQQIAVEEKEEKKDTAKKAFEKWKKEHDELLKEKFKKQKEVENKLKEKTLEKEEERMRNSKSAFSNWDEKKKNVLNEKVTMERQKNKDKAEEERYEKEERDTMALEMYEKWLTKKEREQIRQREERRIQAILRDSPPPPWSPPNKTIPFRK
ncbi:microtubule-associated protein 9 isoform 2-T2 [Polymixia lowei]